MDGNRFGARMAGNVVEAANIMDACLVRFEFIGSGTLPVGKESFEFSVLGHRLSIREVSRTDDFKARLEMDLVCIASEFDQAERLAKKNVENVLAFLSLITSNHFSELRVARMTDWTRDIEEREDRVFRYAPKPNVLSRSLGGRFSDSLSTLLSRPHSPAVINALEWWNTALSSNSPAERFQAYWLCIETLVGAMSPNQPKVPDKCKKCGNALYCESCKEHTTHRPFASQKMRALMSEALDDNGALYTRAEEARHRVFHGGKLISDGLNVGDLVNDMGHAALECLWLMINKTTGHFDVHVEQRIRYNPIDIRLELLGRHILPLYDGWPRAEDLPPIDVRPVWNGERYQLVGKDIDSGKFPRMRPDEAD